VFKELLFVVFGFKINQFLFKAITILNYVYNLLVEIKWTYLCYFQQIKSAFGQITAGPIAVLYILFNDFCTAAWEL
jgi:hypothetical protein